MTIEELLKDKSIKSKAKTETISNWVLEKALPIDELIAYAEKQKDAAKATCIEALEFATRQDPRIADETLWTFVIESLSDKAPRIIWESAKVVAHIAHLFPDKLASAIAKLLANTEHEGTVVRWSAAYALAETLKLKTPLNVDLLVAVEKICHKEEKNSIKKIYVDALKKARK